MNEKKIKNTLIHILAVSWQWFIIPAFFIFISILLDKKFNLYLPRSHFDILFAVSFFCLGLFFTFDSYFTLTRKGNGTMLPTHNPTCKLVTEGPYSYCRNPLYFGYLLLLIGTSIFLHSFFLLVLSSVLVSLFILVYIGIFEEKKLTARFGEEYLQYRHQTPRMIPLSYGKLNQKGKYKFLHIIFISLLTLFILTQIRALAIAGILKK